VETTTNVSSSAKGRLTCADKGSSADHPFEANQIETEDPVRLALDAAELGTWNWHLPSGHVGWTPRTYQLFGYLPGSIVISHDLFLKHVHAADRPAVVDWISRAIQERGRTAFEFRIDLPDGSVRWVRSTGRALSDEHGPVVRMVGVIEDVTDQQRHALHAVAIHTPAGRASFSARQVGHILGVAQVTVKRLTAAGEIRSLRSSTKNSQRFAPRDVIDYLRKGSRGAVQFEAAVEAQDVHSCVVYLLEELLAGKPLAMLLDERIRPAARVAPAPFVADLLSRLPYLVPEPPRIAFPALLVEVGTPHGLETEIIASLLCACGHEVLRPAGAPEPNQLGELAERIRSRCVILAIGSGPAGVQQRGLAAAGKIAATRPGATTVCVYGHERWRVPAGVTCARSMRELAAVLLAPESIIGSGLKCASSEAPDRSAHLQKKRFTPDTASSTTRRALPAVCGTKRDTVNTDSYGSEREDCDER
jgi:PAS domain S-box-containing protein